jgi:hypothetical protein
VGPHHPTVRDLRAEIAELRTQLATRAATTDPGEPTAGR